MDNRVLKFIPFGRFGFLSLKLMSFFLDSPNTRHFLFFFVKNYAVPKSIIKWYIRIITASKLFIELERSYDINKSNFLNVEYKKNNESYFLNNSDNSKVTSYETKLYDFIIIGSGPGGLASAYIFAKAGFKVLVVEKGPSTNLQKSNFWLGDVMSSRWINFGNQFLDGDVRISLLQGTGIGGSSAISGMILHELPQFLIKELILYLNGNGIECDEEDFNLFQNFWKKKLNTTVPIRLYPKSTCDYLSKMTSMPRAVTNCQDSGLCLVGCPNSGKNSLDQGLFENLKHQGVDFCFDTEVDLSFDNANEVIVNCTNSDIENSFELKAKHSVIVAAGPLSSPQILRALHPKIKNFGTNLKLNLGPTSAFFYDSDKEDFEKLRMGMEFLDDYAIKYATQSLPKEIALARLWPYSSDPKSSFKEFSSISLWTASIAAKGVGYLFPGKSRGKVGKFQLELEDKQKINESFRVLGKIGLDLGANSILPLSLNQPFNLGKNDLDKSFNTTLGLSLGSSHIFGTLSTTGPFFWPEGLINPNRSKPKFPRVVCVDSSIIPFATGVNPILTILSTSAIICSYLIKKLDK